MPDKFYKLLVITISAYFIGWAFFGQAEINPAQKVAARYSQSQFLFESAIGDISGGIVPCGRSSGTAEQQRPCTTCDLFWLADNLINFVVFKLVPIVATLFILFAGFMMILGGPRPDLMKKGRDMMTYALYGVAIIYSGWMVTNFVLRSIAGDSNVSKNWYKIECAVGGPAEQPPVGSQPSSIPSQPPTTSQPSVSTSMNPSGTLACLFSGINLCQGQSLKLSGGKLTPDSNPVCGVSSCNQYSSALASAAQRTGISLNLLKATIYKESACKINAANTGGNSYGLMQLQPATANTFKNFCGVSETITSSWLMNPANATASICIAAYFYKSLADGACGYSPRNILAGYSAGPGRCQASRDCAGERSCDGSVVRQWECLYDNPQHTVCNGDNTVIGQSSKLNETRYSVVNKLYCVENPGF